MATRLVRKPSQQFSFGSILATGVLVGVFGVFLIVAGIFLIVREGYTRISSVVVSGNSIVETTQLQDAVDSILSEDCFIHASCGYGLWTPIKQIRSSLLSQFPRLQTSSVSYDGNNILNIVATERVVAFRFCLDESLSTCYFADQQSILFERAPHLSDLRYIPTVIPDRTKIAVDLVGTHLPVRLWSVGELYQYKQLTELLIPFARVYNIRYSRRDITVEVDRLYDYSLVGNTAMLKFNRESLSEPERVMYMRASLDRLISFQPFSDNFKIYPQSLDYLDFRFPKRLYMKFETTESEELIEKKVVVN